MDSSEDCAICLQKYLYPVTLPCKHTFCYLCVKGIRSASVTKKCALCRVEFTLESIEKEVSIIPSSHTTGSEMETQPRWFYSGKIDETGWWQFDEINAAAIEADFQITGKRETQIEISGFKYSIDFERMIQYRSDNPERHRRIKRETRIKDLNIKGVAGLRLSSQNEENLENEVCDAMNSLNLTVVDQDDQSTS